VGRNVSDIFDAQDDGQTPLTEEEKPDLIPSHISNRAELNAAEQENIARGYAWARSRRRDLLTECPATIMIAGPATIMVAGESARRGLSAGGAQPRPETGPCGHGLPVAPVRGGFGPA